MQHDNGGASPLSIQEDVSMKVRRKLRAIGRAYEAKLLTPVVKKKVLDYLWNLARTEL